MSNIIDPRVARIDDLVKMQQTIPKCNLSIECDLMLSKWPLYRFMSPKQATDLFIEEYDKAYKESWAINQDRDEAAKMKPTAKLDTTNNNAKYTQMWQARQFADACGAPYDFYLRFCFEFAARRKRKYMPQPNQLSPNPKTEIAWNAEFAKASEDYKLVAFQRLVPMAQYCIAYRSALPAQTEFEKQLCELGRNPAMNSRIFISRRHVELQQLSDASCRDLFGDDVVDRALESAHSDVAAGIGEITTYDAPMPGEDWQACLGIADVEHASSLVCGSCGQQPVCLRVRDIVQKQVIVVTGCDDPLRSRRLANQRRDTAKSRAKKKQAEFTKHEGTIRLTPQLLECNEDTQKDSPRI